MDRKTVLFVCTHNSARSQMAEGLLNHLYGDRFEAFSAGTEKTHVRPLAIEAMKQVGIDISHHYSKTIEELGDKELDIVITVCDNTDRNCPYIPTRGERLHWSFADPAGATGTDSEKLAIFCTVRDQIQDRIVEYFGGD